MISNSFAGLMVIAVSAPITTGDEPRNRMTELVTYGSVGGAAGNSRSYPEAVNGPVIGTWAPPRTQCRLHCTLALVLCIIGFK